MSVVCVAGTGIQHLFSIVPPQSWTVTQNRMQLSAHDDVCR